MPASKHRRKGKTRQRMNLKIVAHTAQPNTAEDEEKMTSADDNLSRFLGEVHRHQVVNRERFADPYRIMQRVNDCFVTAQQALVDPKPVLTGVLCLRSQYAYKAAAGTVLAGQLGEAFAMMRLCLEHAGYALAIFAEPTGDSTPTREQIFLNRHLDDASMTVQKREFRIINICPLRRSGMCSLGRSRVVDTPGTATRTRLPPCRKKPLREPWPEISVLDWCKRLVCSVSGSRDTTMVVAGTDRC
jgi:hypothetical protein